MPFDDKTLKRDGSGITPVPQHFNPTANDYEAILGRNGASRVELYGADGNPTSTDFATQATLAAILAKIIAAPATEAKQDTLISHVDGVEAALATLLTKAGFDAKADVTLSALRDALRGTGSKTLSDLAAALGTLNGKDFATQTTLAAILAKLIAAPATEAKQTSIESKISTIDSVLDSIAAKDFATQTTQSAILSKLSADPATQTTLAAILAKIITAPSTEAKQDALNALIGEVQASPTANTLLARLKNLEDKIDAIIDGSAPAVVHLSGSILQQDPETGVKTVTTTAAEVFAGLAALPGRDKLIVYNEGSNNVYWGKGTVTTTSGFPLLPGDSIVFSLDSSNDTPIYFIAETDIFVRVGELA